VALEFGISIGRVEGVNIDFEEVDTLEGTDTLKVM
jgi:hypothetical protein